MDHVDAIYFCTPKHPPKPTGFYTPPVETNKRVAEKVAHWCAQPNPKARWVIRRLNSLLHLNPKTGNGHTIIKEYHQNKCLKQIKSEQTLSEKKQRYINAISTTSQMQTKSPHVQRTTADASIHQNNAKRIDRCRQKWHQPKHRQRKNKFRESWNRKYKTQ